MTLKTLIKQSLERVKIVFILLVCEEFLTPIKQYVDLRSDNILSL